MLWNHAPIIFFLSSCLYVAPALAEEKSRTQTTEKCFVLKQSTSFLGDLTFYIGPKHVKWLNTKNGTYQSWAAPDWNPYAYDPKRKLFYSTDSVTFTTQIAVIHPVIEDDIDWRCWKKLLKTATLLKHPVTEYGYFPVRWGSISKGKALFATDVPIPKKVGDHLGRIFGCPNLRLAPVQIELVLDGSPMKLMSTQEITESEVPISFFSRPQDFKQAQSAAEVVRGTDVESMNEFASDFLNIGQQKAAAHPRARH